MPMPSLERSLTTHHLPPRHSAVKILSSTDTPEGSFEDRGEVRVCKVAAASGPGSSGGALRCKNYGCQAEFDEACNDETSCRHHTMPPVFHDLRKWWGCCEDKKFTSFEELLALPGCAVGKHSATPPAKELERQASLASATQKARTAAHRRTAPPTAAPVHPLRAHHRRVAPHRCAHCLDLASASHLLVVPCTAVHP